MRPTLSRRAFLHSSVSLVASAPLIGCYAKLSSEANLLPEGRLSSTLVAPTRFGRKGQFLLGVDAVEDTVMYVPTDATADHPLALALLLHGAGQNWRELLEPLTPFAEANHLALVAPSARTRRWDAITRGVFTEDFALIDRSLAAAFSYVPVDPRRLGVIGFSDGASYALTLGVANGPLLRRTLAFSPGSVLDVVPTVGTQCYITHGTADTVLPIDATSRRIVPLLRSLNYDVEYVEFNGGHSVTTTILDAALHWFIE